MPRFDDPAVLQRDDAIGAGDRGHPVRDDDGGAALHQPLERLQQQASVTESTALVGSSRIRIGASFRMRAGDRQPLALAARQRRAALGRRTVS